VTAHTLVKVQHHSEWFWLTSSDSNFRVGMQMTWQSVAGANLCCSCCILFQD